MKHLLSIAIMLGVALHCAGQKSKSDSIQHITLDTLRVTAPAGEPAYRGAATKYWDISNIRIALDFNWNEKTADAKEWIRICPYAYSQDSLVLDAKSMKIAQVMLVTKKSNTALTHSYDQDKLTIRFPHRVNPADSITIYLEYTAMPYGSPIGGSSSISEDRGLYFINTDHSTPHKPSMIWTQGETESNSHWMVTIDKPNSRYTTQLELAVPAGNTSLSNGKLIKQVSGKNGMHTDIWREEMPIQAYAVMFAIGDFSVVKDHWRNKEVNYYVEPEYAQYAKLMFAHTPEMLEYFSHRTGVAYPWNKYSQVVVRDYVSGAMENTSATLLGEFMNQNEREIADRNSEDVVSHELFHQWFGDYVTCESWSNITVNESFANYGEQLWRAHKYGKAAGDELASNDVGIYTASAQFNNDPPLVRYHYDSREDVFDAISYNKGGAILRYINAILGDDIFDKAMNIYLTRNALHAAEAQNWRMAIEAASGQDWNWFFDQWYFRGGHPILKVSYHYDDAAGNMKVLISQTQDDSTHIYNLPLKYLIAYGNDKKIVDWNPSHRKDSLVFEYRNGVKPVFVPDIEHVLPGEIKDGKKPAQWLEQYRVANDFVSRKLAVNAAGRLMSDSLSQVLLDFALIDSMPSVRKLALIQIRGAQNERYRRRWTDKVINMATHDSSNQVRALALEVLGDWKVKSAETEMVKSLGNRSYLVAGAALEAINKIDKDTAYIIARLMERDTPRATLENNIWQIIGARAADQDITLYREHAPYVFSTKKFYFSSSLSAYLKNVKSDAAFAIAADLYANLVSTEGVKTNRSYLEGNFFQAAINQKDNASGTNATDASIARHRLEILKADLQKVIAAEKDPDNLKTLQKKMKDISE